MNEIDLQRLTLAYTTNNPGDAEGLSLYAASLITKERDVKAKIRLLNQEAYAAEQRYHNAVADIELRRCVVQEHCPHHETQTFYGRRGCVWCGKECDD